MDLISGLISFIVHIDVHLTELVSRYGLMTYAFLFLIIFAETGFVITPFLPGDSLLFAAGAIAALGSLNFWLLLAILILAAIIGDTVNYTIGHYFGAKLVAHPKIPINDEHIQKTHAFFDKYGGKAIIFARFVPIVRTFAPFVAGIGAMNYSHFILYNVIGGVVWVVLFTSAGYFFGNLPAIKHNFTLVILAIIALSVVPMIIEFIKSKKSPRHPGKGS